MHLPGNKSIMQKNELRLSQSIYNSNKTVQVYFQVFQVYSKGHSLRATEDDRIVPCRKLGL